MKPNITSIKSISNLLPSASNKTKNSFMSKSSDTDELAEGQTLCGNLDIRINSDGLWFYQGSPIGREKIVKLFASVLSLDKNGTYWLTTPAEKGEIIVEDVPFQAVEMNVQGEDECQLLSFRTNIDEIIIAGHAHPIRIETNPITDEPSPYIMVRDGLEARLTRAVFYQLVDLGVEMIVETTQGKDIFKEQVFGVWSSRQFFQIGKLTKQN
jgi:hypothetical protein